MTDDTVRVRVTGRQFRHGGEEYHNGDELDVPERAIDGWEHRLERVEAAESDGEEDAAQEPDTDEDGGEEEEDVDLRSRDDLEAQSHDALKELAEQLGIAEETDLRSKGTIVDGILDHVEG